MTIGESFRRLIATTRDSRANLHFAKGDRLRDSGHWAQAAASYRLGLGENPAVFDMWVQYGHALKESGDLAAAGDAYHKALEIRSADADLHLQLGHYYKVAGDISKSVRHYRRSVELGSNEFEAFKGSHASFSADGLAALLRFPSDGNRTFIARELKDIDTLHCLLLGRRPGTAENRERYLGLPLLAVADAIVGSQEFASEVVRPIVRSGALPHEKLGQEEWWRTLEFLPASGLLSREVTGVDEQLNGHAMCRLEGAQFIEMAYWEILWREPDPHGRAFNLGRVEGGTPKRRILEDLLSSAEFEGTSRLITVDWEETADPLTVRRGANAKLVDLLSGAVDREAIEPSARDWYLTALEAGAPHRQIAELILRRFGPEEQSRLGAESREPDWRGLLHALFAQRPLAKFLASRRGDVADEFVGCLGFSFREMRVFRNGLLALDVKALMDLPGVVGGDSLDQRGYEVFRELANVLIEQHARVNAHPG